MIVFVEYILIYKIDGRTHLGSIIQHLKVSVYLFFCQQKLYKSTPHLIFSHVKCDIQKRYIKRSNYNLQRELFVNHINLNLR